MHVLKAVLGALILCACQAPAKVALPPPKVGTVDVLEAEISDELRFPGRTTAPQRVELRVQVEGSIHERMFSDGERVERGDVLFKIDARSPEAALSQAKAQLAQAKVNAAEVGKIAAANQKLLDEGVIGREELRQSKAEADAAQALVRANQAIVEGAALTRGFATVVAPFSGRVGKALIDVGAVVSRSSGPLAVLSRIDPMYVDFSLNEREFLRLPSTRELREEVRARAQGAKPEKKPEKKPETTPEKKPETTPEEGEGAERGRAGLDEELNERLLVALQLADGSVHPFQGALQIVSVELEETTGTYTVRAIFPNEDELLLPGLFAEVIIRPRAKHRALLIPQESVSLKQWGKVIYVVDDGGIVDERRVELGTVVGDLVEVRDGIEAGERVVSRGVHKCREGLYVEPAEVEPSTLDSDPLAVVPAVGPDGWFQRFMVERRVATLVGS